MRGDVLALRPEDANLLGDVHANHAVVATDPAIRVHAVLMGEVQEIRHVEAAARTPALGHEFGGHPLVKGVVAALARTTDLLQFEVVELVAGGDDRIATTINILDGLVLDRRGGLDGHNDRGSYHYSLSGLRGFLSLFGSGRFDLVGEVLGHEFLRQADPATVRIGVVAVLGGALETGGGGGEALLDQSGGGGGEGALVAHCSEFERRNGVVGAASGAIHENGLGVVELDGHLNSPFGVCGSVGRDDRKP